MALNTGTGLGLLSRGGLVSLLPTLSGHGFGPDSVLPRPAFAKALALLSCCAACVVRPILTRNALLLHALLREADRGSRPCGFLAPNVCGHERRLL